METGAGSAHYRFCYWLAHRRSYLRPTLRDNISPIVTLGDPSSRQPVASKDVDWRLYSVLSILVKPQMCLSAGVIRHIAPKLLASFSSLTWNSVQESVQSSDVIMGLACQEHHDPDRAQSLSASVRTEQTSRSPIADWLSSMVSAKRRPLTERSSTVRQGTVHWGHISCPSIMTDSPA